ncbi:hypothetical protein FisN_14Lh370 [Fistulifera solaris]|uniref:Integrase catalytic domain-containing protein n=1 Tax=Fistulifera solaris TaxID=1519565 RepID=A0A1Z5JHX1_FISSO|nr:hypothetical protein FisN_14Lh370 [Fistulifera solaris]|eukprot:GAX13599.1 hypothetical protein FisN_14Lh370 [Fistulifera solaris]
MSDDFIEREVEDAHADSLRAPFDHVLEVILGFNKDSTLYLALVENGWDDVDCFRGFCEQDIQALANYRSKKKTPILLPGALSTFRTWVRFCRSLPPMGPDGYLQLTREGFLDFRRSDIGDAVPTSPATFANDTDLRTPMRRGATIVPSTFTPKPTKSPADYFRQSIKIDTTVYPVFRVASEWHSWLREFRLHAKAQDMSDVLNPDYEPMSSESAALFRAKQEVMMSIFVRTLKTPVAESFLYENDVTAQQVFMSLLNYYTNSAHAEFASNSLLQDIISWRYGVTPWTGSTEHFILKWVGMIRDYELTNGTGDLTEAVKLNLAKQLMSSISAFSTVGQIAEQNRIHYGHAPTFDSYTELLKTQAQTYDKEFPSSKHSKFTKNFPPPRKVYSHEIGELVSYDGNYVEEGETFYDTYATDRNQRTTAPRVDSTTWSSLTENDRRGWLSISSSGRAAILGRETAVQRTANIHDIKLGDLLSVFAHDSERNSSLGEDKHVSFSPEPATTTPLVTNGTGSSGGNSGSAAFPNGKRPPHPASMSALLGVPSSRPATSAPREVNAVRYLVSLHDHEPALSLVDRGANGGVAGDDVRLISRSPHHTVDIQGIDNHMMNSVPIATVGGVIDTQLGPRIAIFHNYAYIGRGSSIHSSAQLESFRNRVDDRSLAVGGTQRITTLDGHVIPLRFQRGLARLPIRPFTDAEYDLLPHLIMTDEHSWDPADLDRDPPTDLDTEQHDAFRRTTLFDECGNYFGRVVASHSTHSCHDGELDNDLLVSDALGATLVRRPRLHTPLLDVNFMSTNNPRNFPSPFAEVLTSLDDVVGAFAHYHHLPAMVMTSPVLQVFGTDSTNPTSDVTPDLPPLPGRNVTPGKKDYAELRPFLGWLGVETVRKTFQHTTQYAHLPGGTILKKHFKSPHPALNVTRRNEDLATDTIFAKCPAIDSGVTMAQIFVGTTSKVIDVYPLKTESQFVNTLEDVIRERGAPNRLISDSAKVETSLKVQHILRTLYIGEWQSEPAHQHQNPAERTIQYLKTSCNTIMDRTGAPPDLWLLALQYTASLLSHVFNDSIDGVPLQRCTGSTPDISVFLRFHFYQKVYYKLDDSTFPTSTREGLGYMVGISDNVGHALTYKILSADTGRILLRSNLRPVTDADPNWRAEPHRGESSCVNSPVLGDTPNDSSNGPSNTAETLWRAAPIKNYSDLQGRSFLLQPRDDGQRFRATVIEALGDFENSHDTSPDHVKFRCSVNNNEYEEILSYQELMDLLAENQGDDEVYWRFRSISDHQGPLKPDDPNYKGSLYNVKVEWENGETTWEPLNIFKKDAPVECAIYAREHKLMHLDGWKSFKKIAKQNDKVFSRIVKQAKLQNYRSSKKYKFGYEIALSEEDAARLDRINGNTLWGDSIDLEIGALDEYDTFHDNGHKDKCKPPEGYLYSGVVTLRGLRIVCFISELNELILYATDIGNAYLEAFTKEKLYFIAGPSFGARAGHILVINKALYGLRTSGLRWHERFADVLRTMGFFPSKAEPDIWMRENEGLYEYVAVYVDDIAIAARDPMSIVTELTETHKFKLKGTGPISYHLGMDFFRDGEGHLCYAPRKYIERMMKAYETLFGEKPKRTYHSPLVPGDHPETDMSELLDEEGIKKYQSLIGALQWVITIGRFDIMTAVMTLSSFRAAPRRGHLERAKRIYGYLFCMRNAAICIRTKEPDFSAIPDPGHDWKYSVYGGTKEEIPHDAPKALGKFVTTVHYVDANLMHCTLTGKSVTGILHFLNGTPIEWYSKKQATVETATFGSEYTAARTCVEQIIDLRLTLRYLGVPIREKSYVFGDNKTVIDTASTPHGKLNKRHTALSYHRVREAVASGMVGFYHMPGEFNAADIGCPANLPFPTTMGNG